MRDQSPILLYDQVQKFPRPSPKPDWNKIQAYIQKTSDPMHNYFCQLQIVFKENSGLSMDVESA